MLSAGSFRYIRVPALVSGERRQTRKDFVEARAVSRNARLAMRPMKPIGFRSKYFPNECQRAGKR